MRDGKHPQYMENGGWLKESLERCCEQYFTWALEECMSEGELILTTNKYFADFHSSMCLQDCPEGPFCCNRAPPRTVLYDSIEACCGIAMSLVDHSYCYSRSIGGYSNGWVVDYEGSKCCMYPTECVLVLSLSMIPKVL